MPDPLVTAAAVVWMFLTAPVPSAAELRTSSFSLAGVTTARLEMRLNYQHFAAGDSLDLEISADGGWSWTLLRHDQRDLGAFAIADGDRVEVDLSDFAGRPQLVLRIPGQADHLFRRPPTSVPTALDHPSLGQAEEPQAPPGGRDEMWINRMGCRFAV